MEVAPLDYSNSLQIPETAKYKIGVSPAIQDIAQQSGKPISEILALQDKAANEVHKEEIKNPGEQVMDDNGAVDNNRKIYNMLLTDVFSTEDEDEIASDEDIDDAMSDGFGPMDFTDTDMGLFDEDNTPESTIDDPMSIFGLDGTDEAMGAFSEDSDPFTEDTFATDEDTAETPEDVNKTPDSTKPSDEENTTDED